MSSSNIHSRPQSPAFPNTAPTNTATSPPTSFSAVGNQDPTADLRASVEAFLMQTAAGAPPLMQPPTDPCSMDTTGKMNTTSSSLFSPSLNESPLLATSNETGGTEDASTSAAADTTTDLVAALLAMLQRQGNSSEAEGLQPCSKVSQGTDSSFPHAEDGSKAVITPTTATTTATPSPSASIEMGPSTPDDTNSATTTAMTRSTPIDPSTTPNSSTAEQSMHITAASFAPLLGGETAAQWSGLNDLISTLLTSASASPEACQSTVCSTTAYPTQSHPTASETFHPPSTTLNDITTTGEQMSSFSSPEQEASSILSGLSSSIAATLTSPGNASLASGLSSALLGDRATVGDLASILSPSESASGMTTPCLGTSDMTSPATLGGTSDYPMHQEDRNVSAPSDLRIPVMVTGPLVLSQGDPFGSAVLSPSSKARTLCGSETLNAGGMGNQPTTEELLGSMEEFAGERTPGSGSNRDDGIGSGETPRSLLFHGDGSLNLEFFKVFPCKNESHVHDRKNCPFHHSQRDRRRQPVTYNAEQCEDHFDLEGDFACACPNGDNCDKCHNRHELLYHPDIYKQRFCSSYNHLECHRGRFCAFAHTREEIRCDLFTEEEERIPKSDFFMKKFKTLWCPYGVQHDWHGCLYAHTYQDCRRSPSISYGSEPCPYWQKDLHSADYQKRCPFGPRCPYSHGSKEQLYHPAYYKTMPCADYKTKRTCPRSELCAFYHDISEKRPAIPSPATTGTPSTQGESPSGEDSDGTKLYDYTRPIPHQLMNLLQPNFMRPPLFNLDDFEAFGHASRIGSGRRESNSSSHRSAHNSPHSSSSRPAAFPSHAWPDSPAYPSIHHHNQQSSFFRPGMATPASAPSRSNYHQHHHQHHHQHQPMYPMYNSRNSSSGSNNSNSGNFGHHSSGHSQSHQLYTPFAGRHHHHQQQRHQQFLSSSPHQQVSSPYHNNHPSQRPPAGTMYDDRFFYEPFSTSSSSRRPLARQHLQRSSNSSPVQMSAPRMRYNSQKDEMFMGGRSRDRRAPSDSSKLLANEDRLNPPNAPPSSSTNNRLC